HTLVPPRPEARDAEDGPVRRDGLRRTHLPPAPDVGEQSLVGVKLVPVEHRPDLLCLVLAPRDELEVPPQLVGGEPAHALLPEDAPPAARQPRRATGLPRPGGLHPTSQKHIQIHAETIITYGDPSLLARDPAELDDDTRGVCIVSVL